MTRIGWSIPVFMVMLPFMTHRKSMSTDTIHRMKLTEWFMLVSLSIIWGGSFFFNAIALRGMPPLLVVWGRVGVGFFGLVCILALSSLEVRQYLNRWRDFLVLGVFNTFIPFSLIVWGQQYIGSGLASIINATTPAFTIVVAHFFTRDEPASVRRLFGAAVGLLGVAVLIGTDALSGFGNHVFAQFAIMGAALSYACAATYGRRLYGVPSMVTACGQLFSSFLVMTPVVLLSCRPWEMAFPGYDALGAVLGLGLICSALAYVLFFRILRTAGATNVQLVTLLIPLSASAMGIFILGEPFSWRLIAAMLIVFTAAALIDGRFSLRRFRR
ncbi:DMT family transporter [uncultured Pseudodesulfovibrio sp.]|uniref:DMT family transporter n=1 Tax=uncultured Pseudodesulfovibrio sp. TaxID=2035858 RepID=UPI0029C6C412|nr:DMT family transporter [uncultured Pseudodesulfovibrio sp.]